MLTREVGYHWLCVCTGVGGGRGGGERSDILTHDKRATAPHCQEYPQTLYLVAGTGPQVSVAPPAIGQMSMTLHRMSMTYTLEVN